MFQIKTLDGQTVYAGWALMSRLVMWADWQVRQAGYDPESVTAAALKATYRDAPA